MMSTRPVLPALIAVVALSSCGGDNSAGVSTTTSKATTSEIATTAVSGPTTTRTVLLEQPAIWPAADVVFDTPEQAAADFVTHVLGVEPVLGTFQQGDSRSGEIEVFSPGEGAGARVPRGLLLLRQLGPDNGWFVIGAANDFASIASPESMAVIPAGPLTVAGAARGFEANVVVTAILAGDAKTVLDSEITMGGAKDTAAPYSAVVDLSAAAPGDVVALIVRGGAGLETDPGDFGAIPVVIAG
jgi:hypothetical protein